MGDALIRSKSIDDDLHVVFTIQLIIALLIYSTFYLTAPLIAKFFNNTLIIDLLRISALTFLIRPFQIILRSQLKRNMRFKPLSVIDIIVSLISVTASVSMALSGFGVWSLILSGLISAILGAVMLAFIYPWKPGIKFNKDKAKNLGSYGIKISTNEIILYMKRQTGNLLISKFLGVSMVGLFNKADSLAVLPSTIIAGSTYQTVFRALAQEQDNLDKSKYLYLKSITLISVYTFPFYVGIWWLAKPFIYIIYGEKWIFATEPLEVLAILGFIRCLGNPSGAVLAARNLLTEEIKIQITTWIILASFIFIAIQYGGITEVAWAMLASSSYTLLRMLILAGNSLNLSIKHYCQALKPAILLNLLLFLFLCIVHALTKGLGELSITYFIAMSISGLFLCISCFLYLPIPKLVGESVRWKKKLRFPYKVYS